MHTKRFIIDMKDLPNKLRELKGEPLNYSISTSLPSRWDMLKNLVQAAADAARSGFDVRNGEETEACLRICDQCEFLRDGPRCGKCGCHLRAKVLMKAWHCPASKW